LIAAGAASVVVVHGEIVSEDQDKKLVTLQADNGKPVTVHTIRTIWRRPSPASDS
jgi:hypothetical protein